ncbi:MAG: aldehyde dehydrogenase family protein [Phycisphaerales bacterium]|nr:aldehyde dehydrogenase family protein [Phycisphaerales bacterium]
MTTMPTQTDTNTLNSYNPSTGEIVGSVPITPVAQIDSIIAKAHAALPAWQALSAQERADMLKPAGKILEERAEELGKLLSLEQGKPISEGIGEVKGCAARMDWESQEVANAVQPEILKSNGIESTIYYDGYGVCATITPWNFPMLMAHWTIVPALVAGNTVVCKPSEQTPLIADEYVKILNQFLPEGVLQIIHGEDDQGKALVAGDVNMIAFTGSKNAGQHIMASAAKGLKRLVLELGSKDPLVVLEGADLDKAAEYGVRNALRNCGQVCVSTERIYVQDSIKDQFVDKLKAQVAEFKVADCHEESARIGPMVMREQKEHVLGQIKDAIDKGAKVVMGNEPMDGNFVAPTLLDNCNHDMDIMVVETFGPVVCVQSVSSADEAVKLANDTEYGLGAVVFGEEQLARKVGRQLTAGMIGVNKAIGGASGTPWVGARHSGFSYHSGPMGHRQFCQVRVISTNDE